MGVNGIYGLSGSGLDVESMVKAGMLTKQRQYDKMYKQSTKQEWIKEAYNSVYNKLAEFQGVASDFKLSSKLMTMSAKSTNEGMVTATANGSALAMSHKVKVNSVATNAYLMSADKITRANTDEKAANSNKLADCVFYSIKANDDGTYTIKRTKDSAEEKVAADATALAFEIGNGETETVDDVEKDVMKTISYTFKELAEGKTFSNMATDIKNLGININASYDSVNDSFQMFNSESGENNVINLSMNAVIKDKPADEMDAAAATAATLFNNLQLRQSRNGEMGVPSPTLDDPTNIDTEAVGNMTFTAGGKVKAYGTDASVTIDGKEYKNLEKNYLQVAGVNYTFNDAQVGQTATVTVTQDTEAITKNMQEFVDKYNELIDELNKLVSEEASTYDPLTDEEKKDMTEAQIKTWEEKAKTGLLSRSDILKSIISSLRESIYTPVAGVDSKYNSASAIGITSSNSKGHLTLDKAKLEKALGEDPDCVYQIFASTGESSEWEALTDEQKKSGNYNHLRTWEDLSDKERASGQYNYLKKDTYNNTGIANRLYFLSLSDGMKKVEDYAGLSKDYHDQSALGLKITTMRTRMESFKTMMDKYQDSLYKKYDNLEVLIQKMSVQLSMVTGGNG